MKCKIVFSVMILNVAVIVAGCGADSAGMVDYEVRLKPGRDAADIPEASLVLLREGEPLRQWPLGAVGTDDLSGVQIHRTSKAGARAWWLAWRLGSGTGLGQWCGAVVWITDGGDPALWQGIWRRTESFLGPDAYEFDYSTALVLDGNGKPRLVVRVTGRDRKNARIDATVQCRPRQQADGGWTFAAEEDSRPVARGLLELDCLSGIHHQLRMLLARPGLAEGRR